MKKTIIITGSLGLIGYQATLFFCEKGFNVIGIDNDKRKYFFGPEASTKKNLIILKQSYKNYKHFNADIKSKKLIFNIFKKNCKKNIVSVIHCAAQPSHDYSYNNLNLDFEINTIGTINLLNAFKLYIPKSTFIFASTNKVYGDNPNKEIYLENKHRYNISKNSKYCKGFNETLSVDNCVHSFFGASKLSSDIYVQEFGKNYKLNTVCFRFGCLTGKLHKGVKLHGFLSYLVKSITKKNLYEIIGYKGKQVRDNLHSYDAVTAIWEYIKKPTKGEVYNLGGGIKNSCSILEAISCLKDNYKIYPKIKLNHKQRKGDHIWYITDNRKFKKHYPKWKIKYSLKKIYDELINSL